MFGILFIITRFTEMQGVAEVLQRGNIWFIGLALVVEGVWLVNNGWTYKAVYAVMEMPARTFYMARLAASANFVNVVAPTGGVSSVAYLISEARRSNRPAVRVTLASVLYLWLEYVATMAVLTLGLGILARRNNLHWSEITASLILMGGALGIAILLYLGMKSARLLSRALSWLASGVNWVLRPFLKRDYLSLARAHSFAYEAAEGIRALRHNPKLMVRPVVHALLNKTLLLIIFTLMFFAFEVPVDAEVVVAGFSICYLFLIVSPTPAGIGIVEGILTVALTGLRVPLEDATVITLAYRGVTFWAPLLVGMLTFRTMHISVDRDHVDKGQVGG